MQFLRQLSAVARGAAALALLVMTSPVMALTIGDPAPAITVSKWVKGDAVASFEKGKIYVVEFWASWCGPCKVSIPHLTEMSHQYKDVTFIGTSVWERQDGLVEPFVKQMGEKMDYRVAEDDKSSEATGAMAVNWMQAAQQNGIPTAFIVGKDSTILWIGHPMQMEPVLKKVVDGTYDVAAAKTAMAKEQEAKAVMEKLGAEIREKVGPSVQAKEFSKAIEAVDAMITAHPEAREQLNKIKMNISAMGKQWDSFYTAADVVAELGNDDPQKLNELAWTIVSSPNIEKKDFDRILKYAQRAVEISKRQDAMILDTLANVYFENGDKANAVKIQEEAIAKAPEGDVKKELQASLDKFKSAAK